MIVGLSLRETGVWKKLIFSRFVVVLLLPPPLSVLSLVQYLLSGSEEDKRGNDE